MSGHSSAIHSIVALLLITISAILPAGCAFRSLPESSPSFVATLEALEDIVASQATEISAQATMISYLATRGPVHLVNTPEPQPTPYYPVSGSVVIEDDRCCAGAAAGETLELKARFEASSPFGEVTHMRVHSGSGSQRVNQVPASVPWEPFTEARTFTVEVALNWTGFFVTAQFRDELGNLSPLISDDISIEGMPPPTP